MRQVRDKKNVGKGMKCVVRVTFYCFSLGHAGTFDNPAGFGGDS